MSFKAQVKLSIVVAALMGAALAVADERGERGGHSEPARGAERARPERPEPPKFQAHPPGQHPHGPIVRQHAVRVLAPRTVGRGDHAWAHWNHPEFSRPTYYWDWAAVHTVTCVAEDSYGDQYPVTENGFAGFALGNMTTVEDDALDRCYSESGQDGTCYLNTCSHI